MAYGSSLTYSVPTVGVTTGPTYATTINNCIIELQDIIEQKVNPADIVINADMSFTSSGTAYGITDIKRVSFTNQSAALSASTYPNALYFAGTAGDLYVNDGSGNQIQMTASGVLNAAAVNGITGTGYGSTGVAVEWVAASTKYLMKSGAGVDSYADVEMDDLRLNDGSGHFVSVTAQSMSADYTVTLPAAAPASTQLVHMNSSGTLSVSNTVTNAVTFSNNITVSGSVADNLTFSSNKNITLAGTGYVKHGTYTLNIPGAVFSSSSTYSVSGMAVICALNDSSFTAPIPLEAGCRILSITGYVTTSSEAGNRYMYLSYLTPSSFGGATTNAVAETSTSTSTNVTLTNSPSLTLSSTIAYGIRMVLKDNDNFRGVVITYDKP